ncbi:MAG: DMT family transporter [Planctomycetes bacterium]|nr:DMT family transporter [Planctomycetota bacterium]
MPYLGELAAVATAISWAVSGIAFGVATRAVGGFATNHFRIWAAWPLLASIVWFATGSLWPSGLDGERGGLLLLSGLIGMVIGDVGYFHALATIGPRLASVIMASWPLVAILCGPLGGDRFRLDNLPGALVTVAGVVLVLWCSRGGSAWNPNMTRRQWWGGTLGALIASCGQAIGVLLSRRAMAASPELPAGIDPLAATLVRVTAGVIGMQLFAMLQRRPLAGLSVTRQRRPFSGAMIGTVLGPVLGVWMSMLATRHCADVGTGAALMATAPLFMLPLAWFAYGSRIGPGALVGTLLTVAGAAWLMTTAAA